MQAVEFESFVDDGVISIPDTFKDQVEGRVKVIILSDNITQKTAKLGGWEGKIWMADDFDAPLDDFKE